MDVILTRLNDNDAKVVHEAIHLLEDADLADHSAINDLLQKLLQRDRDDWTSIQQSIVRYMSRHSTNEQHFVHLLFPSNASELQLLTHLLDTHKSSLTPLMKLAKKTFKNQQGEVSSGAMENFLQSISDHDDRTKMLRPIFDQKDEILRLMESSRPNWIKFAVIYILLGIEALKHQEWTEFAVRMIFKLLQKLSKEVSRSTRSTAATNSLSLSPDFRWQW